jgi:hypothetical protein
LFTLVAQHDAEPGRNNRSSMSTTAAVTTVKGRCSHFLIVLGHPERCIRTMVSATKTSGKAWPGQVSWVTSLISTLSCGSPKAVCCVLLVSVTWWVPNVHTVVSFITSLPIRLPRDVPSTTLKACLYIQLISLAQINLIHYRIRPTENHPSKKFFATPLVYFYR